jgi:hypothetical protein
VDSIEPEIKTLRSGQHGVVKFKTNEPDIKPAKRINRSCPNIKRSKPNQYAIKKWPEFKNPGFQLY